MYVYKLKISSDAINAHMEYLDDKYIIFSTISFGPIPNIRSPSSRNPNLVQLGLKAVRQIFEKYPDSTRPDKAL